MTEKDIIDTINFYNKEVANILNKPMQTIRVEFSNSVRNAGTCYKHSYLNNTSIIKISTKLAKIRTQQETHNTIVHELCHAYNDKNDKHGPHWKRIAKIVGNALNFKITRCFLLSDEQQDTLQKTFKSKRPIAIIEVPEISYKKYIYRKCRGYYDEYKNWSLNINGKKYSLKFTKLV